MIASTFAYLHWRRASPMRARICAVLFLIASAFSVHSVRGYIAMNVLAATEPAARAHDLYRSLTREIDHDLDHLAALRSTMLKAPRRRRRTLAREATRIERRIKETRRHLATTTVTTTAPPLAGLDWFLGLTLWFFNATCWTAWFGTRPITCTSTISIGRSRDRDRAPADDDAGSVAAWLAAYEGENPAHCAQLFEHYEAWCTRRGSQALTARRFYARLIALGARKFREGRAGPILYALPAAGPHARPTSDPMVH